MQLQSSETQDPSPPKSLSSPHTHDSSYRESLLEHLFAGEVLSHLWKQKYTRLEVLKPQVDNSGYDLVLEANGVVRHVQLKTSHIGAATPAVNVHLTLGRKPSGCVIWTWFDPTSLALGPYWWFGGSPGEKLSRIDRYPVTTYTKANAEGIKLERHNLRRVPRAAFKERFHTVDDVVAQLFGSLPYVEQPGDVDETLGDD